MYVLYGKLVRIPRYLGTYLGNRHEKIAIASKVLYRTWLIIIATDLHAGRSRFPSIKIPVHYPIPSQSRSASQQL